ncbi:MAG: hypothetical protein QMC74_15420, partial [Myxococcota bacterium]
THLRTRSRPRTLSLSSDDWLVGYWELYPLSDRRSLGFYGTGGDVGPAIPRRIQATITRKNGSVRGGSGS